MPLDFPPTDVVCVCYDMGGTNVFKAVTDKLNSKQSPKGYNYAAVVMGTAADNAVKTVGFTPEKVRNITLLGSQTNVTANDWDRTKALPERDVIEVVNSIKKMNPEVVIFEAVSKVQHQIAEALAKDDNFKDRIVVYYDNVNMCIHDNPNHATILAFVNSNFRILLPSFTISDDLARKTPNISSKNFEIVGHPGIESAVETIENLKLDKAAILSNLHLSESTPVLTYIGGYLHGYDEAFTFFASQFLSLRESNPQHETTHLIVTLHPKMNGEELVNLHEFKVLERMGINNYTIIQGSKIHRRNTDEPFDICFETFLLPEDVKINSRHAIAVSSLVLSQSSTMIPEAMLAGIPAHFVNNTNQKNTMETCGLCQNLNKPLSLVMYFNTALSSSDASKEQLFEKARLVTNSAERISNLLIEMMPSTQQAEAM